MLTLKIDTSNNQEISIAIIKDKNILKKIISDTKLLRSQAALPLIDRILIESKLTLKDINAIEVVEGPGSFTGLRVGVSIANAFGFLLKIPVNGKKIGDLVIPVYN